MHEERVALKVREMLESVGLAGLEETLRGMILFEIEECAKIADAHPGVLYGHNEDSQCECGKEIAAKIRERGKQGNVKCPDCGKRFHGELQADWNECPYCGRSISFLCDGQEI